MITLSEKEQHLFEKYYECKFAIRDIMNYVILNSEIGNLFISGNLEDSTLPSSLENLIKILKFNKGILNKMIIEMGLNEDNKKIVEEFLTTTKWITLKDGDYFFTLSSLECFADYNPKLFHGVELIKRYFK